MNVTSELLSIYVDRQADADQARAVEEAVAADPVLAAELEDLTALAALFGDVEPEPVSDELTRRLHALDAARSLPGFKLVKTPRERRRVSWVTWAVAAAATVLVAIGVSRLAHKPEVVLKDFARVTVGAGGEMAGLNRVKQITVRAGDLLKTAARERLSFRTPDGDRITLLPGSTLEVGDPRDGQIFELHRGTVLCSVLRRDEPRRVDAGSYRIHLPREAQFGVRIQGAAIKPAGAAAGGPEVTVTVSKGTVEVTQNGLRREVSAFQRVVLKGGREVESTHAAVDPMFFDLMRKPFRFHAREIIPGYFMAEPGVRPVSQVWMQRRDGAYVVALSDGGELAARATHLVLYVRASKPGPARLTRVRPFGAQGLAEAVTVSTDPVGKNWTVVAVPLAAFRAKSAERENRKLPDGMSQLVRLELRPADEETKLELKASLWADRPPVALPEVVR